MMKKNTFFIVAYCMLLPLTVQGMKIIRKSRIGGKRPYNTITFLNKSEYDIEFKKIIKKKDKKNKDRQGGKQEAEVKKGRYLKLLLISGGSTKVQLPLDETILMEVNGHTYEFKKHRLEKTCKKDIHCAWDGIDQVFRIVQHNAPFEAQAMLAIWAKIPLDLYEISDDNN